VEQNAWLAESDALSRGRPPPAACRPARASRRNRRALGDSRLLCGWHMC